MIGAGAVAAKMGAGEYAPAIERACAEFGIDTPLEVAHFLAQISVESSGFKRLVESLNYDIPGLLRTFSRERISEERCHALGRIDHVRPADQEGIANNVYGGEWGLTHLGNTQPGDGWKYRGHGLAQITGRENTGKCSLALFGDQRLLTTPALMIEPETAARSAAWFWNTKRCDAYAARDKVVAVTRAWNGGINGIDQRAERLRYAKSQLGLTRAA